MRSFLATGALLAATALAAVPLRATTGPAAAPASADQMALTIDNFVFSKARLDIAAGTRVTWTNRDDTPHTITAVENPRAIRSPALDDGDSYTRLFAQPGTYRYFCSLHPTMQGMVVVH